MNMFVYKTASVAYIGQVHWCKLDRFWLQLRETDERMEKTSYSCVYATENSDIGLPSLKQTDRPKDGRTDRWTDRPSYRDAWTHLKIDMFGTCSWCLRDGACSMLRTRFSLNSSTILVSNVIFPTLSLTTGVICTQLYIPMLVCHVPWKTSFFQDLKGNEREWSKTWGRKCRYLSNPDFSRMSMTLFTLMLYPKSALGRKKWLVIKAMRYCYGTGTIDQKLSLIRFPKFTTVPGFSAGWPKVSVT